MHRLSLFVTLIAIILPATSGVTQEPNSDPAPAARLAGFEPFFGDWTAKDAVRELPPGELQISIRPILAHSHVLIRVQYQPQQGGTFELMQMTAGWSAEHKALRFHAADYDGSGSGVAVFEDGHLKLEGTGVRFHGQKIERKAVYRRNNENLVVRLTDHIDGKLEEREFVLHPKATVGAATQTIAIPKQTSTAEDLAKELQGTWKLEQANGRWTEKTVIGLTGKLARYDADGTVRHAHESEFALTEHNGIRRFHLKKLTITAGPEKGMVVPEGFLGGYVYRIDGDELIEVQGMEAGGRKTRLFRWKRVAAKDG